MNRRYRIGKSMLIALALSASALALAQDRARDRTRDPAADRDRVATQDRAQDRIANRDRLEDRDQDRIQDRDRDPDRLQDRDQRQVHVQDREQLRDRDIYGSELMTREERREYRNRIQSAETMQQWARFRAEHQQRMLARARPENVTLPPPFYGQQLMTDQERERLRERLDNAANEQERVRIRNEHREQMQARAREHQIPSSELGE
jgi:hypothetical protein